MMTLDEYVNEARELADWFHDRQIEPQDAIVIMSKVIAANIVAYIKTGYTDIVADNFKEMFSDDLSIAKGIKAEDESIVI